MSDMILPPSQIMAEFRISSPIFVAETALANVWKVRRADGQDAALKVYKKQTMGNEGAGFVSYRRSGWNSLGTGL